MNRRFLVISGLAAAADRPPDLTCLKYRICLAWSNQSLYTLRLFVLPSPCSAASFFKMSDDDEQQARHAALVEFVGIFEDVSSAPTNLSALSDGVALFEALSEM